MKKILLFSVASLVSVASWGQAQITNGDMELWTEDPTDAPDNWNSFLSADGTWAGVGGDQCDQSSDVRPGSTGTSSARIFSNSILGVVANGNMTLGRIRMGSTTASSTSNYNRSVVGDTDFSEALTYMPDSIVFWAKFTPNGGNGNARMRAALHTGNYDFRDPEDAASTAELVASAAINYPSTQGEWRRFSVPFDYSAGTATTVEYILVTFTTNETPGGGDDNDQVWIDDVELIYNPVAGIEEGNLSTVLASVNKNGNIAVTGLGDQEASYELYSAAGQLIQSGDVTPEIVVNGTTGVYFIKITTDASVYSFQVHKR